LVADRRSRACAKLVGIELPKSRRGRQEGPEAVGKKAPAKKAPAKKLRPRRLRKKVTRSKPASALPTRVARTDQPLDSESP